MDIDNQLEELDKRIKQAINYAVHELELNVAQIIGVLELNKQDVLDRAK